MHVRAELGFYRLEALPSRIAFEIALFPENIPLPEPKVLAYILGSFMHFVHFCVWVSQLSFQAVDEDDWRSNYRDNSNAPWISWVRGHKSST
jgi:hypothetical protein